MYRSLTLTSSYGAGALHTSAWQNGSPINIYGSSTNYLNQYYQKSIETLLLAMVQQQIKDLVTNQNNAAEEEPSDQNSNGDDNTTSAHHHHCGCPCYTPPPEPEPPAQPQISTYDEILKNIRKLSQFIENNNVMQSSNNYNEYLSHSTRDQNTVRQIYQNGGRVISQHQSYILAEDAKQNRYIVSRY